MRNGRSLRAANGQREGFQAMGFTPQGKNLYAEIFLFFYISSATSFPSVHILPNALYLGTGEDTYLNQLLPCAVGGGCRLKFILLV